MFRFKFKPKGRDNFFCSPSIEESALKSKMSDSANQVAKVTIKETSFAAEYGDNFKNNRSGIVLARNGKKYYLLDSSSLNSAASGVLEDLTPPTTFTVPEGVSIIKITDRFESLIGYYNVTPGGVYGLWYTNWMEDKSSLINGDKYIVYQALGMDANGDKNYRSSNKNIMMGKYTWYTTSYKEATSKVKNINPEKSYRIYYGDDITAEAKTSTVTEFKISDE